MKHHFMTLGFLVAALACYGAGIGGGVLAFAAAGLIFESIFWFRLIRRTRRSRG